VLSGQKNLAGDFGGGEDGTPDGAWNEILSGFVVTAVATTKPDSSGGFAGQVGWEECAPQCAVMVRSRVRTGRPRGALPHAIQGTIRRAATASSTRGRAYA